MRYCPDNIGRHTIREMLTYMNSTLLNFYYVSRHCITNKKVLSVLVRLGQRTYNDSCNSSAHRSVRGIVFGITCILVILSTINYYYFLNCITCIQRKEAFVLILQ